QACRRVCPANVAPHDGVDLPPGWRGGDDNRICVGLEIGDGRVGSGVRLAETMAGADGRAPVAKHRLDNLRLLMPQSMSEPVLDPGGRTPRNIVAWLAPAGRQDGNGLRGHRVRSGAF